MLHNLLPKAQKKKLRNEYVVRLASTALFLCSVAVVIGVASLVPGYISLTSAINELEPESSDPMSQEEAPLTVLSKTAQTLMVLESSATSEPMTDLLLPILEARTPDIQIISISFDRKSLSFSLRGIAATRDALVAYRRVVSEIDRVLDVASPIENLARNTDLEFTLSVKIAPVSS